MRIDRMFIKCTDIANPIIKSDLELDDLSVKDYVEIYRPLRLFIRSIKYKEDDRIVLCG
jgi:hypothetical protein